jgi:hypothetical protein
MPETDTSPQAPRIGLALVGDGFRASLFHLGAIRCLEARGIMSHVEVISAVSAGALTGAYYLIELERRLRANPYRSRLSACDDVINSFCTTIGGDLAGRAGCFGPLHHPAAALRHRFGGGDSPRVAEFARSFFAPNLCVADLPRQVLTHNDTGSVEVEGTRLLLNTMSHQARRKRVWSRESDLGLEAELAASGENHVPLANVVVAAMAATGEHAPVRIGADCLSDASLLDNQGIESVLDYFELSLPEDNQLRKAYRQPDRLAAHERETLILVVDGSGDLSLLESKAEGIDLARTAARRRSLRLLTYLSDRGLLQQFAFAHLPMVVEHPSDGIALPADFVAPLASMRSTLDRFTSLECNALVIHGYSVLGVEILESCDDLHYEIPVSIPIQSAENVDEGDTPEEDEVEDPHPGGQLYGADVISKESPIYRWPPPILELMNSDICTPETVARADQVVQRFLKLSGGCRWRLWRRFPLAAIPQILAIFILAALFSWIFLSIGYNGRNLPAIIADSASEAALWAMPKSVPFIIEHHVDFLLAPTHLRAALGEAGAVRGGIRGIVSLGLFSLAVYLAMWLRWSFVNAFRVHLSLERRMLMGKAARSGRRRRRVTDPEPSTGDSNRRRRRRRGQTRYYLPR